MLELYRPYLEARFVDDPHVLGSVLFREVAALGFDRSYQTFTRELRALGLRPACECCRRGGVDVTIEIDHPPGEELQFDWLELRETPWGERAFVLIGTLSYSGRCRGVFSEGQTGPHVIESLDGVLRRLGGTARRWRTDRMAGVVYPGTDRLLAEFVACAKHYGVGVDVCPARRAKRKGVAEASVKYLTRSWWCSAAVSTLGEAQMSLDRFCVEVADERRRGESTIAKLAISERLLGLPSGPFPAEICVQRPVSRSALVAFEGNHYSVPAVFAGAPEVTVRARLGEQTLLIVSAAGTQIAAHRRAPSGAGQRIRCAEHAAGLEQAVLSAFTTRPPCRRKQNRPPGLRTVSTSAGERSVLTLGIAVRKPVKTDQDDTPTADFFDVTVWGPLAETCATHLAKGRLVGVSARLEPTAWETADGAKRRGMELIASAVEFLDRPRRDTDSSEQRSQDVPVAA